MPRRGELLAALLVTAALVLRPLHASQVSGAVIRDCHKFLEDYAAARSPSSPGGEVDLGDLGDADKEGLFLLENHGMARFLGRTADGAARFRLPGRIHEEVIVRAGTARLARVGTEAARTLAALRVERRFGTEPRNFDLYFGAAGLRDLLRTTVESRAPFATVVEEIWREVAEGSPLWRDRPLEEFASALHLLLHQGGRRGPLHRRAEPEALSLAREFFSRVYRSTGVNLVRTGILSTDFSKWNVDGTLTLQGGLRDPGHSGWIKGPLSEIPADIICEIVLEQWRASERTFEAAGRPMLWLTDFRPAEDAHAPSALVRAFKESGNLADAQPLLDAAATNPSFGALRGRLRAAGNDVLFVPVPGSDGTNQAPAALAGWLRGQVGAGAVTDALSLVGTAKPQKAQRSLWGRLMNVGRRTYRVDPSVRGKVVVLVDDVVTSGISVDVLRRRLLEGGARAVYIFSLARTREAAPADPTVLLELRMPPVDVAPVLFSEAMPSGINEFLPWLDTFLTDGEPPLWMRSDAPAHAETRLAFGRHAAVWVGRRIAEGRGLPWTGRRDKDLSPAEKAVKKLFESSIRSLDIPTLSGLSMEALGAIDEQGRPVANSRLSIAVTLPDDAARLADVLRWLYAARGRSDFPALRGEGIGKLAIAAARERLARPGPLRNQLSSTPEIVSWLDGLP